MAKNHEIKVTTDVNYLPPFIELLIRGVDQYLMFFDVRDVKLQSCFSQKKACASYYHGVLAAIVMVFMGHIFGWQTVA